MRIFVVDYVSSQRHSFLNQRLLEALQKTAEVTFSQYVAPPNDTHVGGRFAKRYQWIRYLRSLSSQHTLQLYDAVLFLAYDAPSLLLSRLRHRRLIVIDHNNIDLATTSLVHRVAYQNLPTALHVVFADYIADHVRQAHGKEVAVLPHPIRVHRIDEAGAQSVRCKKTTLIASLSGSTDHSDNLELAGAVRRMAVPSALVVKSSAEMESTDRIIWTKHLDNYDQTITMASCVYIGGNFKYRVSGVVFDSLSLGTPVVMRRSAFGHYMQALYPNSIRLVDRASDTVAAEFDYELVKRETVRFQKTHCPESIESAMKKLLNQLRIK